MVTPIVEATGLRHHYPTRRRSAPSVDGVDLSLQPGRVVFVLGPNGSGKSTLFKLLLGLLRPDTGSVLVEGRAVHRLPAREVARSISYIPQQGEATFSFSVYDTVLMGRTPHLNPVTHRPTDEDRRIARDAIASLGIEHLADRGLRDLSGGERQLALLARALCQQGRLLILDEPTASLDFANQVRVLREVRRLAASGLGVLVSSHDPMHALRYADELVLLREGRVEWSGTPAEVRDEHLSRLYDIGVRITSSPELPGLRLCVPAPEQEPPHHPETP